MRLARQVQNELDWHILDVEQDEWDRRLADICSAAANGIPLSTAVPQTGQHGPKDGHNDALPGGAPRFGMGRRAVIIGAAACLLAALVGCAAWYKAQAGLTRMQGDVANAVKLESVTARALWPAGRDRESLVAVEFADGSAIASVLVTRTLAGGAAGIHPEVRFYAPTDKGWQRTPPVAAFWGPRAVLDTASLHFEFGEKDRSVVEQLAPAAEALYATLQRATGEDLAQGSLLTIEFVPDLAAPNRGHAYGRVQLRSPLLYHVAPELRSQLCGRLLRQVLADAMIDAALQRTPPKAQWQPMVDGLRNWLWTSAAVQPVAAGGLAGKVSPPALAALQINAGSIEAQVYALENQYQGGQRSAAAAQLVDFVAATYGMDAVARLLQGFAVYDDWEALAPAVFGVSAAELEAAWHRTLKEDPR